MKRVNAAETAESSAKMQQSQAGEDVELLRDALESARCVQTLYILCAVRMRPTPFF